jgi:hypothetical protein
LLNKFKAVDSEKVKKLEKDRAKFFMEMRKAEYDTGVPSITTIKDVEDQRTEYIAKVEEITANRQIQDLH